jgi:hypothetical protein
MLPGTQCLSTHHTAGHLGAGEPKRDAPDRKIIESDALRMNFE